MVFLRWVALKVALMKHLREVILSMHPLKVVLMKQLMDLLLSLLAPLLNLIGFPPENLPLALMRPLSGSGSLGLLTDLVNEYGADSLTAKIGATMYGSSETTFYVLAVYFGSVAVTRSRHALLAGLTADAVGALSAVYICKLLIG